ncbi:MAG: cupin domain-containing protein [Candidatus Zhuqueibacterota bacterium]
MDKVVIDKMISLLKEPWLPLDIFKVNSTIVRLVKIKGKYHWHKHQNQDELFIILKGQLIINLEDTRITLEEGEGYVVKKGIVHQTESKGETVVMLVEPKDIVTRGD